MRIALALLALFVAVPLLAADPAVPAISADSRLLLESENLWMAAARERNGGELRRFMSGSFRASAFGDAGSTPTPRRDWIDNVLRHQETLSFSLERPGTQIIGDIGIVTGAYHWVGSNEGVRFERNGRLVDTWIRHRGNWAVISRILVE